MEANGESSVRLEAIGASAKKVHLHPGRLAAVAELFLSVQLITKSFKKGDDMSRTLSRHVGILTLSILSHQSTSEALKMT